MMISTLDLLVVTVLFFAWASIVGLQAWTKSRLGKKLDKLIEISSQK